MSSGSNINLHLNLVESVLFLGLKILRFVQDLISQFFWKIFAEPALYIAWLLTRESAKDKPRTILLKRDKILMYVWWWPFKFLLNANSWLNGLMNGYNYYHHLLTWNPAIPLIALKNTLDNPTYQIMWLGEKHAGTNSYQLKDMMWVGVSNVSGHFRIVEKTTSENSTLIKCVWISGDLSGAVFTVSDLLSENNHNKLPDYVYFPPRVVILACEMLISFGIIAFISNIWTTFNVSTHLQPIFEKIHHITW